MHGKPAICCPDVRLPMFSTQRIRINYLVYRGSGRIQEFARRKRNSCLPQVMGPFVDLLLEDKVHIALSDGVNMRYCPAGAGIPPKYQLLITFDDDSFLVFTVAMYGGINAFRDTLDNPYYLGALSKPSPLGDGFDAAYFDRLVAGAKPNLSAKAFLATEQRIPGLGNGVLQDILSMPGFILSGRWRRLVSVNWTRCSAL